MRSLTRDRGHPPVSQKDLEKVLTEAMTPEELKMLQKMKARIDFIGDIEDAKKLSEQLK
jgi:hypothetical protein